MNDMHRLPDDASFAAIDIGSHTIRLLIGRVAAQSREITPLCVERRITRLARGFQNEKILHRSAMQASLEALKEYAALAEQNGVRSIISGATGVMRRAGNTEDLLRSIQKEIGIRVSVLSEEVEAFLSAKGCLSVLPNRDGVIVSFDLGGSSTELLFADSRYEEPIWSTSVFIGAATVTERFLLAAPPSAADVAGARAAIREAIGPSLARIEDLLKADGRQSVPFQLVGTAGTVTTLAAMLLGMSIYGPYRINGQELSEDWLSEAIDLFSRTTLADRRAIPGLEPGREDIIFGGALIVKEILEGLGLTRLTVTDGGLLEGLLLDLIEKEYGWHGSLLSSLKWRFGKS